VPKGRALTALGRSGALGVLGAEGLAGATVCGSMTNRVVTKLWSECLSFLFLMLRSAKLVVVIVALCLRLGVSNDHGQDKKKHHLNKN